jgi:hypothetical protein
VCLQRWRAGGRRNRKGFGRRAVVLSSRLTGELATFPFGSYDDSVALGDAARCALHRGFLLRALHCHCPRRFRLQLVIGLLKQDVRRQPAWCLQGTRALLPLASYLFRVLAYWLVDLLPNAIIREYRHTLPKSQVSSSNDSRPYPC